MDMSSLSKTTLSMNNILESTESALQDGVIQKDELSEIKDQISKSDLPQDSKEKLTKLIDKASSDSNGFLFIFGRGISNNELSELKQMASSFGDDSKINTLYKTIEESVLNRRSEDINAIKDLNFSKFTPSTIDFVDDIKHKIGMSNPNERPVSSVEPSSPSITNPRSYYVTQNGNGLSTGGRDCGPACASMVLKKFGIFDQKTSSRDCILDVRKASGNKSTAFSEGNLERAVETLSNGKVKMLEDKSGFGRDPKVFSDYLRGELDKGMMPVIEIGSPYHDNNPNFQGRHYMVVSEVRDDGSLVVADPGGKQICTLSPERLSELLRKGSDRGNHVLSFGAN